MTSGWAAATLLWLGVGASAATSQGSPCLTQTEVESLALMLMPDLLRATGTRCAQTLPVTATLRGGLPALVLRYGNEGISAQSEASAALGKISGEKMRGVDPEAMVPLIKAMVTAELIRTVKPQDCLRYERLATLLAPLPPRNTAGLLVMLLEIGISRDRKSPFKLCAAIAP